MGRNDTRIRENSCPTPNDDPATCLFDASSSSWDNFLIGHDELNAWHTWTWKMFSANKMIECFAVNRNCVKCKSGLNCCICKYSLPIPTVLHSNHISHNSPSHIVVFITSTLFVFCHCFNSMGIDLHEKNETNEAMWWEW